MCNACGFLCCGSDRFGGCGCDHCDNPECWDDDSYLDEDDDDYPDCTEHGCCTPQPNRMASPELQAVLADALAKSAKEGE